MPVGIPNDATATNVHDALGIEPTIEGNVTPVTLCVLPVSSIRMLICESWVCLVHSGENVGVGWLETAQVALLIQITVAHMTVDLKEIYVRFLTLALRHCGDHIAIDKAANEGDVFIATCGVDCFHR